jgi:hypothetical protein
MPASPSSGVKVPIISLSVYQSHQSIVPLPFPGPLPTSPSFGAIGRATRPARSLHPCHTTSPPLPPHQRSPLLGQHCQRRVEGKPATTASNSSLFHTAVWLSCRQQPSHRVSISNNTSCEEMSVTCCLATPPINLCHNNQPAPLLMLSQMRSYSRHHWQRKGLTTSLTYLITTTTTTAIFTIVTILTPSPAPSSFHCWLNEPERQC